MPKGKTRKPMNASLKDNFNYLNTNKDVEKWAKKTR